MAQVTYHMDVALTPTKTVTLYTAAAVPEDKDDLPTFTHDIEAEPRTHTLWNHVEEGLIKLGHIDPENFTLVVDDTP